MYLVRTRGVEAVRVGTYTLGGVGLAGEAVTHVQQYLELFHYVSWIGPLFVLNAVACLLMIAGLALAQTRRLAALGGIVVSTVALGGLVVSYGHGLFGWQEAGMRAPIILTVIFELMAVIFLAAGLVPRSAVRQRSP